MDREYWVKNGLFVGIIALICAFYFFASSVFTFKSSLIQVNGEVENVETSYNRVEGFRSGNSVKSELKFTLKSSPSVYILSKNIGQSGYDPRFGKLAKEIEDSGSVTLWIKRDEKDKFKPFVFQLSDRNGEIVYGIDESKSASKVGFFSSLGLGIFGIGLYLCFKYWKRLNNKNRIE